jgi:hypothetical protein
MYVDNGRMSVDITLMSMAPRPLSVAVGRGPYSLSQEVRMTKRFPRSEPDIATLAVRVIDGLTNAAEDFPAPPVSPERDDHGRGSAICRSNPASYGWRGHHSSID